MNVELIAAAMKFVKNEEQAVIKLNDGRSIQGKIIAFDGKNIKIDAGKDVIALEMVSSITEYVVPSYDDFNGNRVYVQKSDGTRIDGILYDTDSTGISIITEKGIEVLAHDAISDVELFYNDESTVINEENDNLDQTKEEYAETVDEVTDEINTDTEIKFVTTLIPGTYFDFERAVDDDATLSPEVKNECKKNFNNQNYAETMQLLQSNNASQSICDYIRDVMLRYESEKGKLIPDGTSFYKGIVASKIELNLDKGFNLFLKACEETPEKLSNAVYRALIVYLVSKNTERSVEAADVLFSYVKKIMPEYKQNTCLKTMLTIYANANMWDKYLSTLRYLVKVSESHPTACFNSIMKFTKNLELNYKDDSILDIYTKAYQLNENNVIAILRMVNYLSYRVEKGDLYEELLKYIEKEELEREWPVVEKDHIEVLFASDDKYQYIDGIGNIADTESTPNESDKGTGEKTAEKKVENLQEKVEENSEKNVITETTEDTLHEKLEREFLKYRNSRDASGARGKYAAMLKRHSTEQEYVQISLRADLYFTQSNVFSKKKGNREDRYTLAMNAWITDRDIIKAEQYFMDEIMADSEMKGTAILSYVDMTAVEYGISNAIGIVLNLQQDIKYCDRSEKIAFYEKKYNLAIAIEDVPNALNALETLRTMYFNKGKLGNTWYRTAECYLKQGKWSQAKNTYEKAIEYGYMTNVCNHRIMYCRANMGEKIDGSIGVLAKENVQMESIDSIKRKVESNFNECKYHEANTYVKKILNNFPDDEELVELAERVEKIAQVFSEKGSGLPSGNNNPSIALRAWHIEDNMQKAKEYFLKEIDGGGNKKFSCLMNMSDLVLHTDGLDEAIKFLKKYEEQVQNSEKVSFYEKLYLMVLKTDDQIILDTLNNLLDLYSSNGKAQKKAFTYFRIAGTYYHAKKYDEAIESMLSAIKGGYHSNYCYKCIAISYAYIGEFDEATDFINALRKNENISTDVNTQAYLNELEEQVDNIKHKIESGIEEDNRADEELVIDDFTSEFMLGFDTRFEAFFAEKYSNNPVGILTEKVEQNMFTEADVSRLEREARQHKLRESMGYYGTAAYIENQLNPNSSRYYTLLGNAARSWGLELQKNGSFNCASSCYEFAMENEAHNGSGGNKSAINYLYCVLRKRRFDDIPDDKQALKELMKSMMIEVIDLADSIGESIIKEFLLIFYKNKFSRDCFSEINDNKKEIWIEQLANYISVTEAVSGVEELNEAIRKRISQDENKIFNLTNKIESSKVFNEEQLTELRGLKEVVFAFDVDMKYLDATINAYEKGIEIYDYTDYDNRMATIGNVQNQLASLRENMAVLPTYFGINYLLAIIDNLSNIISELAKKTKDELRPDLGIVVPISDIPIVDGFQGVSVTITNKENSASARDVRLRVMDVDGRKLITQFPVAQYLKGGRSVSSELKIPNQGDNYTVKISINFVDHEDKLQETEELISISSATEVFEPIKSPYFTGDSIDVTQTNIFVGRDVLLDSLENALCNNKSGCEIIYGQKRCGKSSIANFLEERLKTEFIIIKFSIGAARSTKSVYVNIKDLVIEKIDDMIDAPGIPESINEDLLSEIEDKSIEDDEDFVSFMRLVHRKLCKPLNKDILLMIDEFTHLYRYVKEDRRQVAAFMDTWKKLLEANLFKAVLIGQDTMPNFIKEFQNQFQVTQPIRVDRLDDESVRKLISEPLLLPNGESRFMENSVELIASWFYGQPYYIQLYCDRLVQQMNTEKKVRVTNALAEKVKTLMLEEADEDLFDNLISRGDESGTEGECYEILKCIAQLTKISEWADIDEIEAENREVLIDDLINRTVIRKKENKCKILISFFREWLNNN